MLREYMKFHEFNDTRSLISNRETIRRECNKFIETTIEYVFPFKKKKKKKEEEEKIQCAHISDVSGYKWRDINTSEIKLK